MSRNKSLFFKQIITRSLLNLDDGFSQLFVDNGIVKVFSEGELIAKAGETLDDLIIPLDESLKLFLTKTGTNEHKFLSYLVAGRSLAIYKIIENLPLDYDVRAEHESKVLHVPREKFIEFLNTRSELRNYLKLMASNSAIRRLKGSLEDVGYSIHDIVRIIGAINSERKVLARNEQLTISNKIIFIARGELSIQSQVLEDYKCLEGDWAGAETELYLSKDIKINAKNESFFNLCSLEQLKKLLGENFSILLENHRKDFSQKNEKIKIIVSKIKALSVSNREKSDLKSEFNIENLYRKTESDSFLKVYARNLEILFDFKCNTSLFDYSNSLINEVPQSLYKLSKIFSQQGITSNIYNLDYEKLNSFTGATILIKGNILIHLKSNSEYSYFVNLTGKLLKVENAFLIKSWDGQALIFSNDEAEEGWGKEDFPWLKKLISKLLGSESKLFTYSVILGVLLIFIDLLIPKLTEFLIDDVLPSKDIISVITCIVGLLICSIFNFLISYFSRIQILKYGNEFELKMSNSFFKKALEMPNQAIHQITIGGLLNRVFELANIRSFISQTYVTIYTTIISLIIYLLILFYYDKRIGFACLALIPVLIIFRFAFRNLIKESAQVSFEKDSLSNSLLNELISSINTVKSSGVEKSLSSKWEKVLLSNIKATQKMEENQLFAKHSVTFFSSIFKMGVLWFCCYIALDGDLKFGALFAVSQYIVSFLGPLNLLAELFSQYDEINVSAQKVNDVFKAPKEQELSKTELAHVYPVNGEIEFRNLFFKYNDQQDWVLRDINLKIFPQQTVALVGESGCGKTTLANLLAGFYYPNLGKIFIDGFDLGIISLQNYREQIGYLPQHAQLFSGSILENIAIGEDIIDKNRVTKVLELSKADEIVNKFPSGVEQYLAQGGMGVSGGEKQRLALARVLYKNPKVLILDESTSALDASSEQKVMTNIRENYLRVTTIIIAHRLSTIKKADKIFVMDKGSIVEVGSHDELIKLNGHYMKLFGNQIKLEANI